MKKYSISIVVIVVGILFYQTAFGTVHLPEKNTPFPSTKVNKTDYALERTPESDVIELPLYSEEKDTNSVVFTRRGAARHFISIES